MKFFLMLAAVLVGSVLQAAPEYPNQGPDIYDPGAEGSAQIASALKQAKAEGKNVLVDFGANWCPWCHRLHETFSSNAKIKRQLEREYVVVYVDVNMRKGTKRNAEVNTKYGNPIKEGLPVLVVLSPDDKVLVTQETGALEEGDHHDPAKVRAFLARWAPKRP